MKDIGRSSRIKLERTTAEDGEENPHVLRCRGGDLRFDWNPPHIYIMHIGAKHENQGIARRLLCRLYEIGAGGTITFGTIVAHKRAAEGFVRIQEKLCRKHGVVAGHFRLNPT